MERPHPGEGLLIITHGQRGWGSDSGQGHPHREEERGGRGGKRGGREKGEEGPGDWRGGDGGGGGVHRPGPSSSPRPSFPAGSSLLACFSNLGSPKTFFWCEIGHSTFPQESAVLGESVVPKKEAGRSSPNYFWKPLSTRASIFFAVRPRAERRRRPQRRRVGEEIHAHLAHR